jgi:hypothetical protein
LLPIPLDPFVYVYARLAHGLTPGCFYVYACRGALVQFSTGTKGTDCQPRTNSVLTRIVSRERHQNANERHETMGIDGIFEVCVSRHGQTVSIMIIRLIAAAECGDGK